MTVCKVLVTGGAGFIGSHIVDKLVEEKYEVGVLDNLSTGNLANVSDHVSSKRIEFHNCDISDFDSVSKVVKEYDAVIHEAALVSVSRSVENPLLTNKVNVDGTVNLLKASVDSGVQKFIYASSSSVYGDTETLPKKETMVTVPISPYGVSKLAAENYCRTFSKVYSLKTVCLRYFNVYGPRQKYGHYSGVIPIFIRKALNDEAPVIDGDGEQTRDFTYVSDVVQANLLALRKDVSPGTVYNAAAGGMISINDLARHILDLTGRENLKPVHGKPRVGDIRASYADIGMISRELGFNPRVGIEEGLGRVVDWFRSGNQLESEAP
ncbi:MAG: SDR family oxidoreductase, partial [Nitrososphaerota archaeon]|nr:SDR family oxidoreductase [Nitrososphaerota archaeon]